MYDAKASMALCVCVGVCIDVDVSVVGVLSKKRHAETKLFFSSVNQIERRSKMTMTKVMSN